jgi:ABC-type Zn uptake system ZnuABC Zn-binding protein ZnuA
MKRVAEDVAAALSALHPDNAEEIAESLNTYLGQLDALDEELEATYAQVQGLPLIFMHGAWDRLVDRYNLNQVAVIEPFPGREPSASYLAGVLDTIGAYDAQVIFSERQLNPRPANVIAQEAGVQVAILDPVGGGDAGSYSQMMRSNARTIVDALTAAE